MEDALRDDIMDPAGDEPADVEMTPSRGPGEPAEGGVSRDENVFSQTVRNVVVQLLRYGSISQDDSPEAYAVYLQTRGRIAEFLRNINIQAVDDEAYGMVYIRNLRREEEETADGGSEDEDSQDLADPENEGTDSGLITSRRLNAFDSVVLLMLRRHFHLRSGQGETTVALDTDQLEGMILPYVGTMARSTARVRRRLNGVLKRFKEYRLVKIISSPQGERIVIRPLIRIALSYDDMKNLLEAYEKAAIQAGSGLLENGDDDVLDDDMEQDE